MRFFRLGRRSKEVVERKKEEKCDGHTLQQPHLVSLTMTRVTFVLVV